MRYLLTLLCAAMLSLAAIAQTTAPIRRTPPPAVPMLRPGADGYYTWKPLIVTGFTSRISYIAPDGNDATGIRYPADAPEIGPDPLQPTGPIRAFKTAGAAIDRSRVGQSDAILYRRGSTYAEPETVNMFHLKGRSSLWPALIGAWGPLTQDRPIITSATLGATIIHGQNGGLTSTTGCGNVMLQSLVIAAPGRDPHSPTYTTAARNSAPAGLSTFAKASAIIFDDCRFTFLRGGIELQGIDDSAWITDVMLNRCTVDSCYNANGMSSGIFTAFTWRTTFQESYIIGNGLNLDLGITGSHFNQGLYYNQDSGGLRFMYSLSAENAHAGIQNRGGFDNLVYGSVFALNAMNLNGGHGQNYFPAQYTTFSFIDNSISGSRDAGVSGPRGWGFSGGRCHSMNATGTLIIGSPTSSSTANVYALGLNALSPPTEIAKIAGTVVYNYATSVPGSIIELGTEPWAPGVRFSGNQLFDQNAQFYDARTNPPGAWMQYNTVKVRTPDRGPAATIAGRGVTTSEALRSVGLLSESVVPNFPDPTRNLDTYARSIGLPNQAALFDACKLQRRGAWREDLSPIAIANYLRDGFGMPRVFKRY